MKYDLNHYFYPEDHGVVRRDQCGHMTDNIPDRDGMVWEEFDPTEINGEKVSSYRSTFLLPRVRRDRHIGLPLLVQCKITPFYNDWYNTISYRYEVKLYKNAFFTSGIRMCIVYEGANFDSSVDDAKVYVDLLADWAYEEYERELDAFQKHEDHSPENNKLRIEAIGARHALDDMRRNKYRLKHGLKVHVKEDGVEPIVSPSEEDVPVLKFEAEPWPESISQKKYGILTLDPNQLPKIDSLNACTKERVKKKIRQYERERAALPDIERLIPATWCLNGIKAMSAKEALCIACDTFLVEWGEERCSRMKNVTGGEESAITLAPVFHKNDYHVWMNFKKKAPENGPIQVLPLSYADGEVFEYNVMVKFTWVKKIRPRSTYHTGDAIRDVIMEDLCPPTTEPQNQEKFVGQLVSCSYCGSTSYHCGCD